MLFQFVVPPPPRVYPSSKVPLCISGSFMESGQRISISILRDGKGFEPRASDFDVLGLYKFFRKNRLGLSMWFSGVMIILSGLKWNQIFVWTVVFVTLVSNAIEAITVLVYHCKQMYARTSSIFDCTIFSEIWLIQKWSKRRQFFIVCNILCHHKLRKIISELPKISTGF